MVVVIGWQVASHSDNGIIICFPSTNGVWLLSSGAKSRHTVTMEYVSLPPVVCTVVDDG